MNVFLSQTAGDQLHHIIDYLEQQWSTKVRDNFITKLQRSMQAIEKMPYSFPASEAFPGLRKCVITAQTTAYYRIDEVRKEVEVMAVLDNRQDISF